MRYAIVSDIHANWQAWSAVLSDIRSSEIDSIICLGDVVGYGPRPEEVLNSVRGVTQNFVLGNHDAAACGLLDASIFNQHAREMVRWTEERLGDNSISFLKEVPLTIEMGDLCFVHAEIENPGRFGYIEDAETARHHMSFTLADIVFLGHTHEPQVYRFGRDEAAVYPGESIDLEQGSRYLVNVGSVGEPRDDRDIRATYVIFDVDRKNIDFRKVEFDVVAYRKDLESVGLNITPYFLSVAEFLSSGGRTVAMTEEEKFLSHLPAPPSVEDVGVHLQSQTEEPRRISIPLQEETREKSRVGLIIFILVMMLLGFGLALLILFT